MRKLALLVALLVPAISAAQNIPYSDIVLSASGRPIAGAGVSICTSPGLQTTAASVGSNVATLTFASNPITAGFVAGMTLQVSGFAGADTYFNGGTLSNGAITGGFAILSVTSTTLTYSLSHANASATSSGFAFQQGSVFVSCAPLASITSDQLGLQPITQPGLVSDTLGNYSFYAPASPYTVQLYGSGAVLKGKPVMLGISPYTQLNGECPVTSTASLSAAVVICTTSSTKIHVWSNAGTVSGTGITVNAQLQVDAGALISGTPTINGAILAGSYQIFTGSPTLGTLAASGSIQNVWFPPTGSDCGTQNAHNALPSSGGVIHGENCLASYGTLTFTKPVHFYLPDAAPSAITQLILNAPAIVEGTGPQTWLQCGSTTLPCVVYDLSSYGTAVAPGMGIRRMRLQGPGNSNASATGIAIQGTHVNIASVTEDVEIDGFGSGISCTSNAIGFSEFRRTEVFNNAKALNFNSSCSGEQVAFFGGYLNGNISGGSGIFACNLSIDGQADIKFIGTNMDYAQLCDTQGSFGRIAFSGGSYFECSNSICGTGPVISLTGSGTIQLDAITHIWQGNSGAGTHFLTATSGTVIVKGGVFQDNGGRVSDVVFSIQNTPAYFEPWPTVSSWKGPVSLTGTATINPSNSIFGGNLADVHIGSAADLGIYFGNNASGANQWQWINGATGSGTCGAGNTGFWNGTHCPLAISLNGIANQTGLQLFNTTTACTTAAKAGATCTTAAISLPVTEPDTSYKISCTGHGPTNVPTIVATTISSSSQFTITIAAITAAAATYSSFDCVAGHN